MNAFSLSLTNNELDFSNVYYSILPPNSISEVFINLGNRTIVLEITSKKDSFRIRNHVSLSKKIQDFLSLIRTVLLHEHHLRINCNLRVTDRSHVAHIVSLHKQEVGANLNLKSVSIKVTNSKPRLFMLYIVYNTETNNEIIDVSLLKHSYVTKTDFEIKVESYFSVIKIEFDSQFFSIAAPHYISTHTYRTWNDFISNLQNSIQLLLDRKIICVDSKNPHKKSHKKDQKNYENWLEDNDPSHPQYLPRNFWDNPNQPQKPHWMQNADRKPYQNPILARTWVEKKGIPSQYAYLSTTDLDAEFPWCTEFELSPPESYSILGESIPECKYQFGGFSESCNPGSQRLIQAPTIQDFTSAFFFAYARDIDYIRNAFLVYCNSLLNYPLASISSSMQMVPYIRHILTEQNKYFHRAVRQLHSRIDFDDYLSLVCPDGISSLEEYHKQYEATLETEKDSPYRDPSYKPPHPVSQIVPYIHQCST